MQSYYIHLVQEDLKGKRHFRKSVLQEYSITQVTVDDMMLHLKQHYKYLLQDHSVNLHSHIHGLPVKNKGGVLLSQVMEVDQDVIIMIKERPPTISNQQLNESRKKYEPLSKYSFIGDGAKWAKVVFELKDIGSHPEDKVMVRFFNKSLDLRIEEYQGKNWLFGVPLTQCRLDVEGSRCTRKGDRLTIWVKKVKPEDNWFSLHKTKTIGGEDSD